MATLTEDGFVSVTAGKLMPGKVLTRVLSFEGRHLYLNMIASKHNWGSGPTQGKVELLDSAHTPIPDFTLEEADNLVLSGQHQVSWKGKSDLGSLTGKPIQLRFTARNAKLNSFQFRDE